MIRNRPASLMLALAALATASCSPIGMAVGAGAVAARSVIQERTTQDALTDTEIQLGLNNRLLNHSGSLFSDVSTSVVEGRVLLTGSVPTRSEKIAATDLAWKTPGVASVADELVVSEDSDARAYAEDVWISNQLRFALLTEADVSAVNYSIQTVDGVVHITGLARSKPELARVLDLASRTEGVEKVVSHVLTIDDPRRQATAAGSLRNNTG